MLNHIRIKNKVMLWGVLVLFLTLPSLGSRAFAAMPTTKAGHFAAAQEYEKKASNYMEEASRHLEMKEKYFAKISRQREISSYENYDDRKMRNHCDVVIKKAKELAREMYTFAEWHQAHAEAME